MVETIVFLYSLPVVAVLVCLHHAGTSAGQILRVYQGPFPTFPPISKGHVLLFCQCEVKNRFERCWWGLVAYLPSMYKTRVSSPPCGVKLVCDSAPVTFSPQLCLRHLSLYLTYKLLIFVHVHARGLFVRVISLLPPSGSWGSNSGCQVWW